VPSPTVKKKRRSTFAGTRAGLLQLARLRSFVLNFVAVAVSLKGGKAGLIKARVLVVYVRIPATVVLSKVPNEVVYGHAAIRNEEFGVL
jgi:hypothetical protein